MSQTATTIDEFDHATLTATRDALTDPAFTVEDLGHCNYNLVKSVDANREFGATVLVVAVNEPVRWYASVMSVDSGEPVDGVEFFVGPIAQDTTPEQAAQWVQATYATAQAQALAAK